MFDLDLGIVGGGPAGLSAALVAHGNDLRITVFEASGTLGGQARSADYAISDFLGHLSVTGDALADAFATQVAGLDVPIRLAARIDRVVAETGGFRLELGDEHVLVHRVLLATGARGRALGLAGEHAYGLYGPARRLGEGALGAKVVVIGGGDEAAATARWLAERGAGVTIVARTKLKARPSVLGRLLGGPPVSVMNGDQVIDLEGDGKTLRAVRLASGQTLRADFCLARIGVDPSTPALAPEPLRAPDGHLLVDGHGRTSIPGLYAAGDLVVPGDGRYLSHAAGTGVIAARAVETDRDRDRRP